MLKVATAKEMQAIDRTTIRKYGIAGKTLMERAGLAVVEKINELFFQGLEYGVRGLEKNKKKKLSSVIIVCGGGNNGGDGFVIARVLHKQGIDVKVYLSAKPVALKGDAKLNYDAATALGIKIHPIKSFLSRHGSTRQFDPELTAEGLTAGSKLSTRNCLIVDALLGTGLNNDVRSPLTAVIKKINRLSCPVISVDIASGISSDTGQIMGQAVKADHTVTFGLPKRGHLLYPGADNTGQLHLADIGFPKALTRSKKIKVSLIEDKDIPLLAPKRPKYSHKGTYGHVLLIAGSRGKTGAAFMSAKAVLRSGAGLVTIGVPESLVNVFQSRVTEEMILPLPDKGDGTLSKEAEKMILLFLKKQANVLAIGPGLSVDDEISRLVAGLITRSNVPVVIDADGINALAGRFDSFQSRTSVLIKCKKPVVLTPHPGEMKRLMQGLGTGGRGLAKELHTDIEKDRIGTAVSFAKKTKTYLVLKGVPTVTASPDGQAFINSTGNSGMATAGMGDVLTGMISSFIAQGLKPEKAAALGVYMHGRIGDILARKTGERSLIASDMIRAIPGAFRSAGL